MKRMVLGLGCVLFSIWSSAQPSAAQSSIAQPNVGGQVVDICVYGGSSAGVIAAVTAKRLGKTVVLIEPGRHLGGLSAGGLGATDIGNKFSVTGLARNFYRRIGAQYGHLEQWTFEPHVAEGVFAAYLREARIRPLMNRRLLDVQKAGNRITAITLEPSAAGDVSGRTATNQIIRARQFGGNPDQVVLQTDKADHVQVRIFDGKTARPRIINQQRQNNDWISLGECLVAANTVPYVDVLAAEGKEPVVADAVLFLPSH